MQHMRAHVPEWGFVIFGILCLAIVLCCAFVCIRKLFGKKRHGDKNKKGLKGFFGGKGADLVTIDKSKLQPDLEALEENMEQNEKEQAEQKEENDGRQENFILLQVKLGRIQYKLDYDFQQNQVIAVLAFL
ncbi:Synaptotagmin-1 [Toxocara canis]|uniref:Synaptotagmin-1 n=1 Tax=Toxocara canis TaxID=6265 RepID=A0A0B2UIZ9_TOXCA|nr:Synaptotagmin-1 [Toxocara canis]